MYLTKSRKHQIPEDVQLLTTRFAHLPYVLQANLIVNVI